MIKKEKIIFGQIRCIYIVRVISLRNKSTGIAIPLAWPDTECKQTGAWYDALMYLSGFNKKGYYQVGHAAILLVNIRNSECLYFDFGRYHAPHGYGRVRSVFTDHDLKVHTIPIVADAEVINLEDILIELYNNSSSYGTGPIFGTQIQIDFSKAYNAAVELQKRDFIKYGPFTFRGTNCSRFVNRLLRSGILSYKNRALLNLPWMLTPTPIWNLIALQKQIMKVDYGSKDVLIQDYSEIRLQA